MFSLIREKIEHMNEYGERGILIEAAQLRSWISALAPSQARDRRDADRTHHRQDEIRRTSPVPAASAADASAESPEAALISQLRALEDLKSAAAAAQARTAMALENSRRRTEAAAGVPVSQRGRGVGAEVALARRESPHQGSRLLGLARTLVTDMPHTLRALESGTLNEWRATLIVRETICLSTENRQELDAELAADTGALDGAGNQGLTSRARRIAYRLEPAAAVARARKAVSERHVSCRPAPDTMAYLSALLPAAEAISAFAALSRHADTQIGSGAGKGLGRGRLMADALVERLTGTARGFHRAEVQLIMTDRSLLTDDSEPAELTGYGPVPAQYARDLLRNDARGPSRSADRGPTVPAGESPSPADRGPTVPACESPSLADQGPTVPACESPSLADRGPTVPACESPSLADRGPTVPAGESPFLADGMRSTGTGTEIEIETEIDVNLDHTAQVWVRRLYTAPDSGQLVAMDSRARLFPPGLRRLIAARDSTCRTPYCDAPIRHIDHVVPWRKSGSTSFANGQGLCESCNYVKESPGWSSESRPQRGLQEVERRTPTGHTYVSIAPPLPGTVLPSSPDLLVPPLSTTIPRSPSPSSISSISSISPSSSTSSTMTLPPDTISRRPGANWAVAPAAETSSARVHPVDGASRPKDGAIPEAVDMGSDLPRDEAPMDRLSAFDGVIHRVAV